MQAERVLETCLYVDDLQAAAEFYTRVLGLSLLSRVEGRHVFFRCGAGVFLLFNPATTIQPNNSSRGVPTHGAHGPGHAAFAMPHAEIANWREHLLQNGVAIEKEINWPGGGYSLYFRDPAGNSLELATPKTWGLASD
ncbi:MAG TPA: VOC family protein [Anaerolineae bacterium]|nr:VOC family protein [Anaerolineae bacterium]